jgi:hypothetical protein
MQLKKKTNFPSDMSSGAGLPISGLPPFSPLLEGCQNTTQGSHGNLKFTLQLNLSSSRGVEPEFLAVLKTLSGP